MIIDIHGHVGTWPDFFIPEPSAQWLVETSTRIGIDLTVISHLVAVGHDTITGNRMALAAARQFPGRLGVWLVADPHRSERAADIRAQLDEPGVCGLKLHPDVHEYAITDPGYRPYLELAEESGVPILSHGQTRSPWSDPAQLAEVCRRHERLTLLMGHSGLWVDGFDRAIAFAQEHAGLHLEICGSRLTHRWVVRLVSEAGAHKVLFGSDASFLDPRVGLGKVRMARLTDEERALVLGGNAARILGERWRG